MKLFAMPCAETHPLSGILSRCYRLFERLEMRSETKISVAPNGCHPNFGPFVPTHSHMTRFIVGIEFCVGAIFRLCGLGNVYQSVIRPNSIFMVNSDRPTAIGDCESNAVRSVMVPVNLTLQIPLPIGGSEGWLPCPPPVPFSSGPFAILNAASKVGRESLFPSQSSRRRIVIEQLAKSFRRRYAAVSHDEVTFRFGQGRVGARHTARPADSSRFLTRKEVAR